MALFYYICPRSSVDRASGCGPEGRRFDSSWGYHGDVPERLNGAVSKTAVPETVSGVRIPPSPPGNKMT